MSIFVNVFFCLEFTKFKSTGRAILYTIISPDRPFTRLGLRAYRQIRGLLLYHVVKPSATLAYGKNNDSL